MTMPEKAHIETTCIVVNKALAADAVTDTSRTGLEDSYGNFAGRSRNSRYSFAQDRPASEIRPAGDEFVCPLSGKVEMNLGLPHGDLTFRVSPPGEFLIDLQRYMAHCEGCEASGAAVCHTQAGYRESYRAGAAPGKLTAA